MCAQLSEVPLKVLFATISVALGPELNVIFMANRKQRVEYLKLVTTCKRDLWNRIKAISICSWGVWSKHQLSPKGFCC